MINSLKSLFKLFPELRGLFEGQTATEFDDFLDLHIERCVQRMEAEAHHLHVDSEEKLSAFLTSALSMPGLSAVREGYSNGHVDITIRSESLKSVEQRLAEAKIYSGHSYHIKAIGQLMGRYSTGRQRRGYVIEYIKKPDIASIVINLRKNADMDMPVQQTGTTADHAMRWAYSSDHKHSSGDEIRVIHVNINLHRP